MAPKWTLLFGLLLLAPVAHAVDGVIEINADCAAAGCFGGDALGLPVTISQSGSYRLTSNLSTVDGNTTIIEINADDVTLDLNGFTIAGPVTCAGDPVTGCSSTGTGDGINAVSQLHIRILNGTIRGMGDDGIDATKAVHVERVLLTENGDEGIFCRNACTVSRSKILRNGGNGVFQSASLGAPLVTGASAFTDNVVGGNLVSGIRTNDSSSRTWGNTIVSNGGFGLEIFATAGYGSNVLRDNNGGGANPQVFGGVEIGTNLCQTNTTCP